MLPRVALFRRFHASRSRSSVARGGRACVAGGRSLATVNPAIALKYGAHPCPAGLSRYGSFKSMALTARRPIRSRTPIAVEQQIERAGVGGQIAPEQPAWLEPDSPCPFEAHILHPFRRARPAARQEVEQSARGFDDADIGQARGEFRDK